MMISSQSQKLHQVFISFRGKGQREQIMCFLKSELERSNVNVYIDESETKGMPKTIFFERIRESSVALVFFSDKYPESRWCLNELVEIKKQMETGSIVPIPLFYNVKAEVIQNQTGKFRTPLLKTEDKFRKYVDRSSVKSILETEAMIMEWRQALVSVCGNIGVSNRKCSDADFVEKIVDKVKQLLNHISSPRMVIEKPLTHPQVAVMSLFRAQDLTISDLEGLITKPSTGINDIVSVDTDHLVFLDLISLKKHNLIQRFFEPDQVERSLLVLLGSLEYSDEGFAFKPLFLPKKPKQLHGNKVIVSSEDIQDQSYTSPVQTTNDAAVIGNMFKIADRLQKRPGDDNNSDDALTCYSFLCNIMKLFAMMISPPSHKVFISFGEKQLGETLLSFLKKELETNRISFYVADETKTRIKESKVALVVFSAKYPESHQCLDELVEIKKLMDAGEIDAFPVFYKIKAELVRKIDGWFRYRLFNIEDDFRKSVNRIDDRSVLDTEARIWGWRQALLSIASRPGLSYQHKSDSLFVSNVVAEVKKKTRMYREDSKAAMTAIKCLDDDLFYSLTSFLQGLNRKITDLEGFSEIPNGLISLKLKGHTNLVLLKLRSPRNLVQFQCSDLFKVITEGFPFTPSGAIRLGEPSLALALESNHSEQWSDIPTTNKQYTSGIHIST